MAPAFRPRIGMLMVVLVFLVTIWAGLPDRLLAGWSYALEKGRLQATSDELARVEEVSGAFRKVAQVAIPGVVHIQVSGTMEELKAMREQIEEQVDRPIDEETWRELLRRHMSGSASGVILDQDGYILTNNHVVGDKADILVRLADQREFEARLIGSDPKTDLAVIKIEGENLHPLRFGDSSQMEVGDWVLAVGAPFGLTHTVTHGIISAKGRSDIITGRTNILYQDFLQTDASINPGNSGGPLLNLRGEVVGINTAIATNDQGASAGIGFTIPSNLARRVAEQLMTTGTVARGWLGVSLAELEQDFAPLLKLDEPRGVMINIVYEGSPAQKAGLQCEDVIVEVNGVKVTDIRRLQRVVADLPPESSAHMRIVRDGQPREVEVVLGRQPDNLETATRGAEPILGRPVPTLGLTARTLRPEVVRELRRLARENDSDAQPREIEGGVLVVTTEPEATEESDTVSPGEFIVGVNGRSLAGVPDLLDALRQSTTRDVLRLKVLDEKGVSRDVLVAPK